MKDFWKLPMPSGERVDTWYTFQVDTTSGEIIVYFALFDEEKQSILSTVRVDNYSKGNDLTPSRGDSFLRRRDPAGHRT